LEVFGSHPQLRVVPHCPTFDDKIGKVVEFVNDALHVEGLAGRRKRRRCRVTCEDELSKLAALSSTSTSLVTSTFLDEEMQHSVRRIATVPNTAWLEAFKRIGQETPGGAEAALAAARKHHGALTSSSELSSDVLYERRTKVQAPGAPSQSYLTRRVIKQEDYYTAVESCTKLNNAVTKLVLRFLEGSRYYELFFYLENDDLVLDFSDEASSSGGPPPLPAWLELTGTRDLACQDSASRALQAASAVSTASPQRRPAGVTGDAAAPAGVTGFVLINEERAPKRMRFLRAHSTEEAALGGS